MTYFALRNIYTIELKLQYYLDMILSFTHGASNVVLVVMWWHLFDSNILMLLTDKHVAASVMGWLPALPVTAVVVTLKAM